MNFSKKEAPKQNTSSATKEFQGKRKSHIPFRLNFLFFIVFGLFVALLVQLAYLQIANSDVFAAKIEWSQKTIVEGNAPRGMIYDAKGNVLVGNQGNQAIIYTKKEGMTAQEIVDVSRKLNDLLTIETGKLTERDKKDFFLADATNLKDTQALLTKDETKDEHGSNLSAGAVYQKTVDKVTTEQINFDEETLKVATIFKTINGAYSMTPVYIKNKDVTTTEIATIGEHILDIPGISTGTDWEREYPKGDLMRSILGIVSSEKQGLPEEESDYYLAQGYARNDRVGLSYLEKQYEPVLKGTKSRSEVVINTASNEIESESKVYEGEKGKNLVLTIDTEFQQKVEKILRENYAQLQERGKVDHSEGVYAVVNNPKTGEVNAMVGLAHDTETGKLSDDTLGTINKVFTPGSIIKGATIMAGYDSGVISGNATLVDEPIKISGDAVKQSVFTRWRGRSTLSATEALRDSSNVYMMKIVFLMMGETYVPEMILGDHANVFATLRNTYENFGLGTLTGIDLPGESAGLVPKTFYDGYGQLINGRMGNLLDLSYGNFDAYTPMQIAQYISTIANDGQKVAPHVVKAIVNNDASGNLGEIEENIAPRVMSMVGTPEQIDLIQTGMYQVINSGGTGAAMSGTKYVAAGKTGTAEVPIPDPNNKNELINLVNSSLVAYAPYDNPKVAVTLMLPHLKDEKDQMNTKITKEILDAYYDHYEK